MPAGISVQLNAHDDGSDWEPAVRSLTPPAAALTSRPIAIAVHGELAAVERDWRRFEQYADCTVFQTFDWLSTWQRHIGARDDVRPAIVVGRDGAGDILFILPLATRPLNFARELTWLGSQLCDYNAPLLAPGFSARIGAGRFTEIWRSVLQHIRDESRLRFDLVRLLKMPATVGTQPNPLLDLDVVPNPSGAYATPLGESWDAFYAAKRSASTRGRDRTKRKRLAEFGEIKMVTPESAPDALRTVAVLIEQKTQSFARMGVANLFERPGHAEFYRAIATDPALRHLVHVSRLEVGPQIAAANIGLVFRDTYYHLQASYTDGELARFGPGAAHLHALMRYAIERGLRVYDFTIGDESYKRDWCDGAQQLSDHISFVTRRGALIGAPAMAAQRVKRLIKQTPSLWRAYSKMRALVGSLKSAPAEKATRSTP
jgi:CelD/BcsL family acetyltransferase involved in cellulose biosynthesis